MFSGGGLFCHSRGWGGGRLGGGRSQISLSFLKKKKDFRRLVAFRYKINVSLYVETKFKKKRGSFAGLVTFAALQNADIFRSQFSQLAAAESSKAFVLHSSKVTTAE